jgi:hypothetical protein
MIPADFVAKAGRASTGGGVATGATCDPDLDEEVGAGGVGGCAARSPSLAAAEGAGSRRQGGVCSWPCQTCRSLPSCVARALCPTPYLQDVDDMDDMILGTTPEFNREAADMFFRSPGTAAAAAAAARGGGGGAGGFLPLTPLGPGAAAAAAAHSGGAPSGGGLPRVSANGGGGLGDTAASGVPGAAMAVGMAVAMGWALGAGPASLTPAPGSVAAAAGAGSGSRGASPPSDSGGAGAAAGSSSGGAGATANSGGARGQGGSSPLSARVPSLQPQPLAALRGDPLLALGGLDAGDAALGFGSVGGEEGPEVRRAGDCGVLQQWRGPPRGGRSWLALVGR